MKFWTFFKNYRFSRKHEKCSGKTQVYRFLSVSYFRPYPFYHIYRKCKYGISSIFLRMQFLGIKVVWKEIWELIKEMVGSISLKKYFQISFFIRKLWAATLNYHRSCCWFCKGSFYVGIPLVRPFRFKKVRYMRFSHHCFWR